MALRLALLLACAGHALAAERPVRKHVTWQTLKGIYGSKASVEKSAFQIIEQVFTLAQQELQVARVAANATKAQAAANATKAQAQVGAPAGAPAAPGASRGPEGGDRIPATGPAWTAPPHLAAVTPELKGTALPKFVPLCAAKVEQMVEKRAAYLAQAGAGNDTIGLSLATHFQVVCEGAFPVKEQQCDDTSVQLAQLIESGNPLNPPMPAGPAGAPGGAPAAALAQLRKGSRKVPRAAAPAGAPGGAPGGPAGPTDSGPGWCTAFFNLYFDGVVAANAGGAPAR